jgi:holdfast attachment protein HfaA
MLVSQTKTRPGRGRTLAIAFFMAAGAAAGQASAQSASSSLSAFSKSVGSFEGPVNVSTRDADGNLEIVNGVMQSPQGSIFSNLSSAGVSSASTGAGGVVASGQATAIANNLNVSVSGDYNTVIVNASQTNTGAVTASTVLNGKVNLDGAQ